MKRELSQTQKEYRKFVVRKTNTVRVLIVFLVAILICLIGGFRVVDENNVPLLLSFGVLLIYSVVTVLICKHLVRKDTELCLAAYGNDLDMIRTGLFAELWDEFEDNNFKGWFDGKTVSAVNQNNCIDLTIVRKQHEFSVLIDENAVSIVIDEETDESIEKEIPLSDISDIGQFISIIQEIIYSQP